MTTTLTHQLDRTLVIGAPPPAVFKYFTDLSLIHISEPTRPY